MTSTGTSLVVRAARASAPPSIDGRLADRSQVTYRTSGGNATVDNPDFSITKLNANVVLRWEYRAGSTVYAVWSQGRTEEAYDGRASFGALSRELWRTPATNVFLVKWAHYVGR